MAKQKKTLDNVVTVEIGKYKINIKEGTVFYPQYLPKKEGIELYFEKEILPVFEAFCSEGFIKEEKVGKYIEGFANVPVSLHVSKKANDSSRDISYFLDKFKEVALIVLKEKLDNLKYNFKISGIKPTVDMNNFNRYYIKDIWDRVG